MSYCSRVYKHRNTHSAEEGQKQEPFFSKVHEPNKSTGKNSFFQAKLSVNQPGDSYEKEADAVANSVVNGSSGNSSVQQKRKDGIQRLSTDKEDEKLGTNDARIKRDKDIQQKPMDGNDKELEKKKGIGLQKKDNPLKEQEETKKSSSVQKMPGEGGSASGATSQVSSKIESSAGKGQPMQKGTLHDMNHSFGADFSGVRIHQDAESTHLNQALQSQAFTHGLDIFFNEGKYDPNSSRGKLLLAHELTHVIQQRQVGEENIQKSPAAVGIIAGAVAAAAICAYAFYDYALSHFPDKTDKWKHCWVSCKVASWCGGDAFALILGAAKEAMDAVCDYYGGGCKAEFLDFLADAAGVACANIPFYACSDCCDNAVGGPPFT